MNGQRISVLIGERPYKLTVQSEREEELFRKSAKLIEEKMHEYAKTFAFRDKQDLLAMVTLQFAVECLRLSNTARKDDQLRDQLMAVDCLLDECLPDKR